jgi:hypothetical protein
MRRLLGHDQPVQHQLDNARHPPYIGDPVIPPFHDLCGEYRGRRANGGWVVSFAGLGDAEVRGYKGEPPLTDKAKAKATDRS